MSPKNPLPRLARRLGTPGRLRRNTQVSEAAAHLDATIRFALSMDG
jgi:hypothetical protein